MIKRHKTFPHLQNYPAVLSLHDCTSTFLSPQIVSWDLETWDGHWLVCETAPENLLDSAAQWQMRRHMAKLRITRFLLLLTVTSSQMASGLPKKSTTLTKRKHLGGTKPEVKARRALRLQVSYCNNKPLNCLIASSSSASFASWISLGRKLLHRGHQKLGLVCFRVC